MMIKIAHLLVCLCVWLLGRARANRLNSGPRLCSSDRWAKITRQLVLLLLESSIDFERNILQYFSRSGIFCTVFLLCLRSHLLSVANSRASVSEWVILARTVGDSNAIRIPLCQNIRMPSVLRMTKKHNNWFAWVTLVILILNQATWTAKVETGKLGSRSEDIQATTVKLTDYTNKSFSFGQPVPSIRILGLIQPSENDKTFNWVNQAKWIIRIFAFELDLRASSLHPGRQ